MAKQPQTLAVNILRADHRAFSGLSDVFSSLYSISNEPPGTAFWLSGDRFHHAGSLLLFFSVLNAGSIPVISWYIEYQMVNSCQIKTLVSNNSRLFSTVKIHIKCVPLSQENKLCLIAVNVVRLSRWKELYQTIIFRCHFTTQWSTPVQGVSYCLFIRLYPNLCGCSMGANIPA